MHAATSPAPTSPLFFTHLNEQGKDGRIVAIAHKRLTDEGATTSKARVVTAEEWPVEVVRRPRLSRPCPPTADRPLAK